jgi:acetyl esterase
MFAESDILRDEGEEYRRKLDEAGVKVTTVRYETA